MRTFTEKMKLLLIIPFLLLIGTFSLAYADYTHIGIEWSKTCELLILSGDFITCSTPEFVNTLYENTKLKPSFQKLVNDSQDSPEKKFKANNQILKNKIECVKKDYCNIFQVKQSQKIVYWFNPDKAFRDYLDKIITIQSNMLDRNINNSTNPITDNGITRAISFNTHDLFINSCSRAFLNPNVIYIDLGKVIYYMYKNCKNPEILGKLKDNYEEPLSKHILDITTSHYWQAQQKLKEDIERCKIKC